MKNILVLQHEAHENLAAFEPSLNKPGYKIILKKLYEGEPVPLNEELCDFAAVLILGGSMSANDAEKHGFIHDEIDMIKQAISLKLPILGICLGSQLIAKALGAKISQGIKKEIGWYPLTLAPASNKDAIFGALSSPAMMFQWHGETFETPSGAIRLAASELYKNQAFKYGDRVYGLQFHPEMTQSMLLDWLEKGKSELEAEGIDAQHIIEKSFKFMPGLRNWAKQIAEGWMKLI